MAVTIRATHSGPNGKPAAEIVYSAGTSLEEILAAQKTIFGNTDLFKKLGLKVCGGCFSGLPINFQQQYEEIVQGH